MHKLPFYCLNLLLMLWFSHPAWADKIYKCKDQKGILIYSSSPCPNDAEAISDWTVTTKARPPEILNLVQDGSGHYSVPGQVNDQTLSFIVDTGASMVSLPEQVARAANLTCGEKVNIQTANGTAEACRVVIPNFKFGPFTLKDVAAVAAPNLAMPLLGMNVLQQFKIAQDKGEMHISAR